MGTKSAIECGKIEEMLKKIKESFKGLQILWKYLSVYKRDLIFLSVLGVFFCACKRLGAICDG